jgi:hypothetical protein
MPLSCFVTTHRTRFVMFTMKFMQIAWMSLIGEDSLLRW